MAEALEQVIGGEAYDFKGVACRTQDRTYRYSKPYAVESHPQLTLSTVPVRVGLVQAARVGDYSCRKRRG